MMGYVILVIVLGILYLISEYTEVIVGILIIIIIGAIFVQIIKAYNNAKIKKKLSKKTKESKPPIITRNEIKTTDIKNNTNQIETPKPTPKYIQNESINNVISIEEPVKTQTSYVYKRTKYIDIKDLHIHEDIKDLILSTSNHYIQSLEVVTDPDLHNIEKVPYYPSYSGLTPEQRGVYLKFLSNPYDDSFEIGYVFILFYLLEHNLYFGDEVQAARVIYKLRRYHFNKSFNMYSLNALMYVYGKDILLHFLSEELYDIEFQHALFLYMETTKILPTEIILKHKNKFDFKKDSFVENNYIPFLYELNIQLYKKYKTMGIPLEKYNFYVVTESYQPANVQMTSRKYKYYKNYAYYNNNKFIADIHRILTNTYDIFQEKKRK